MKTSHGLALVACLIATSALAADGQIPKGFHFTPIPRWQAEPETETLCAAIRAECPGIKDRNNIEKDFGYDQIYDAGGTLVGIRMTQSTGCKPLDESLLLGQAHFKLIFRKPGQADLDGNIRLELQNGARAEDVRIVKPSETNISLGCAG